MLNVGHLKSFLLQDSSQAFWTPLVDVVWGHVGPPHHLFLLEHRLCVRNRYDDHSSLLQKLPAVAERLFVFGDMLQRLKDRDGLERIWGIDLGKAVVCRNSLGFKFSPRCLARLHRGQVPVLTERRKKLTVSSADVENGPWLYGLQDRTGHVVVPPPVGVSHLFVQDAVESLIAPNERGSEPKPAGWTPVDLAPALGPELPDTLYEPFISISIPGRRAEMCCSLFHRERLNRTLCPGATDWTLRIARFCRGLHCCLRWARATKADVNSRPCNRGAA